MIPHRIKSLLQKNSVFLGIIVILVGVIFFRFQNVRTHYQVDFSAYWSAGFALIRGQNPYDPGRQLVGNSSFFHSQFLYPPLIAEFFRPLALFAYPLAKQLWFYGQLVSLLGTAFFLYQIALRFYPARARVMLILFFCLSLLSFPLYAEFERGQIDLLTMLLIAASYWGWAVKQRKVLSSSCLCLAALIKPPIIFLFLVPWALRDRRFVRAGIIVMIGLLALSVVWAGIELNKRYWFDYLPTVTRTGELPRHQESIQPEAPPFMAIQSFQEGSGSLTAKIHGWTHFPSSILTLGGFFLLSLFALFKRLRLPKALVDGQNHERAMLWALCMSGILLFHPLTWVMNYVWILFIICLLVVSIDVARMPVPIRLLFCSAVLLIWIPDLESSHRLAEIFMTNRLLLGSCLFFALLLWICHIPPVPQEQTS